MKKIKYSILALIAACGLTTACFNLDEVPSIFETNEA